MEKQFTFKDFITYFSTGVYFIFCVGIFIYCEDKLQFYIDVINELNGFSLIIGVLALIITYLIGHWIHAIGQFILDTNKWVDRKITEKGNRKSTIHKFEVYGLRLLKILLMPKTFLESNRYLKNDIEKIYPHCEKIIPLHCSNNFIEYYHKLLFINQKSEIFYWREVSNLMKGIYTCSLAFTTLSLIFIIFSSSGNIFSTILFLLLTVLTAFRIRQTDRFFVFQVSRVYMLEKQDN